MRALLIPQGDQWAVQCLNFDIAACGSSIAEAKENFLRLVEDQSAVDAHFGRAPLAGVLPAPKAFFEVWDGAQLMDSTPETEWRLINMDTPGAATLMMDAFS